MNSRFLFFLLTFCSIWLASCAQSQAPISSDANSFDIPVLQWQQRSDWVNVKTSGAQGDGVADDTAAIQRAFNAIKDGATIYFPPGTYRITKTLTIQGPLISVSIIGSGRATKIIWDGAVGGAMLKPNGLAYSRYVGLSFEGKSWASVGIQHTNTTRFETEVLHKNLAFRNFTDAGVLSDPTDTMALAETTFENSIFENCKRGVAFLQFNDYDFTFDGCEFVRCEIGIECRRGNFYARNCHFRESRNVDILAMPEHGSSVRRCTSVGSRAFLDYESLVAPMTIQDCHVAAWKRADGAMILNGAPVILLDNTFSDPTNANPPIRVARQGQRLITSNNSAPSSRVMFEAPGQTIRYDVPMGRQQPRRPSTDQSFLKQTAPTQGRVFDAKTDFGARGDGKTDDTVAVQRTIDAARAQGQNALAYFPTGRYNVRRTIGVSGDNYAIAGAGYLSQLSWTGAAGGTLMEVRDPQNITLEQINVGNHDAGAMNNAIDIRQISTGETPSNVIYRNVWTFGMYQKSLRKGFVLSDLSASSRVKLDSVQGNMHFINCARATILANISYEGAVTVEGRDTIRDGFLGFMTRLSTLNTYGLRLLDNQSIVMSDFYVEQANNGIIAEGDAALPPGRATIGFAKTHFLGDEQGPGTALKIGDYKGDLFFGQNQFYTAPVNVKMTGEGRNPLQLFLFGTLFYDTQLQPTLAATAPVYSVGNESRFGTKSNSLRPIKENASAAALSKLSLAFDDLRRLGELDWQMNHPNLR